MTYKNIDGKNLVTMSKSMLKLTTKSRFTLNENKALAVLISLFEPNDKVFTTIIIKARDLFKGMGLDEKNKMMYSRSKTMFKSIMGKIIEVPTDDGIILTAIITKAEYIDSKGIWQIDFAKPLESMYLNQAGNYLSFRLENVVKFKYSASFYIYELMKGNDNIGFITAYIDKMQKSLGTKKSAKNFIADDWNPAIKEINELTDLTIYPKRMIELRKVVAFNCKVVKKSTTKTLENYNLLPTKSSSKPLIVVELEKLGVSTLKACKYVDKGLIYHVDVSVRKDYEKLLETMTEEEIILDKVKLIRLMNINKKFKNIPGAIVSAIEYNWTIKTAERKSTVKLGDNIKIESVEDENKRFEFQKLEEKRIVDLVEELSEDKTNEIRGKLLNHSFFGQKYDKKKSLKWNVFTSPLINSFVSVLLTKDKTASV